MKAQQSKETLPKVTREWRLENTFLLDLLQVRPGQGRTGQGGGPTGDSQEASKGWNTRRAGVWFSWTPTDLEHPPSPPPSPTPGWLLSQNTIPGPAPSSPYLTLFQAVRNFALNLSTSSGSPGAVPGEPRAGPLAPEGPRPLGSGTRGPRGLRPSGRRASSGLPLRYCAAAGDTEFMGAPGGRTEGPGGGRARAPGVGAGPRRPGRR